MEVTLLDVGSLPKGCLLSVKAGTTRRQGAADPEKFKLVFPKGIPAAEAFKVDCLAPIGGASMIMDHSQDRYDVELPNPDGSNVPLRFSLCVRDPASEKAVTPVPPAVAHAQDKPHGVMLPPLGKLEKEEPKDAESTNRRHRLAINARRYLDEHGLLSWAQDLFQDIINQQPTDPWAFINEQAQKLKPPQAKAPPPVPQEAPPAAAEEAQDEAKEAPPPLPDVPSPEKEPDEELESLRATACKSLLHAAESGQLKTALEEVQKEAAEDCPPPLPPSGLKEDAAEDGPPPLPPSGLKEDAAEAIAAANEAEIDIKPEDGPPPLPPPLPPPGLKEAAEEDVAEANEADEDIKPDTTVEDLRNMARETLFKAASEERLSSALERAQVETLKDQAFNALEAVFEKMPSKQPGPEVEGTVAVAMTVQNVDYSMLMKNESLAASFTTSVKKSIAAELDNKVGEEDIDITLRSGSVIVDAKVRPPLGTVLQDLHSKLSAPESSLSTSVCTEIAALDGIAEVATGEITVSKVACAVEAVAPTIPEREVADDDAEDEEKDMDAVQLKCAGPAQTCPSTPSQLKEVREEASSPGIEDLRLQARSAFLDAGRGGKLGDVLLKVQREPIHDAELEKARANARNALVQALLGDEIAESKAVAQEDKADHESLEAARLKARDALLKFDQDNPEIEGGGFDIETLKARARQVLSSASADGTLDELVQKEMAKQANKEEEEAGDKTGTTDEDELRTQVAATLLHASKDGRLASALQSKAADKEMPPAPDVDALKEQAKAALLVASEDGTLVSLLDEVKKTAVGQDTEDLRENARNLLANASADGRLASILSDMQAPQTEEDTMDAPDMDIDALREQAKAALTSASTDGRLEQILNDSKGADATAEAAVDIDALREQAKAALTTASTDGRLEQILNDSKGADATAEAAVDINALREQAKAALTSASTDGRLEQILGESKEAKTAADAEVDVEVLREQAKAAFTSAGADGRLVAILAKAKETEPEDTEPHVDIDALREQAKAALTGASADGRLEQILGESKGVEPRPADAEVDVEALREQAKAALTETEPEDTEPHVDIDALREQAKATLASASADGRLAAILSESKEVEPRPADAEVDIEALREQAKATLASASADGRLAAVLVEAKEAQPEKVDVEVLRQQAQATLASASADGRLAAILGEPREMVEADAEVDDIREEARAALVDACTDGRLDRALSDACGADMVVANEDVNMLREKGRNSIVLAHDDGRLEALLAARAGKAREVEGTVAVAMTVKNVDYSLLMNNESLAASFAASVKTSIAAELDNKVSEEDIDITLRAGSVIVDAKVRPPPGTALQDVHAKLSAPESSLNTSVCTKIAALDGIAEVATGEIAVSEVACAVEPVAPPPIPAREVEDEDEEDEEEDMEVSLLKCAGPPQARPETPPEVREVRNEIKELRAWTVKTKTELVEIKSAAKNELAQLCEQARETSTVVAELRQQAEEARRELQGSDSPVKALQGEACQEDAELKEAVEEVSLPAEAPPLLSPASADAPSAWAAEAPETAAGAEDSSAVKAVMEAEQATTVVEELPATPAAISCSHELLVVEEAEEVAAPPQKAVPADKPVAKPAKKLSASASAPSLSKSGLGGSSLAELEQRIRERNDRFRRENEALRSQNSKLKDLRRFGEETKKLGLDNENLRKDIKSRLSSMS